MLKSRKIATFLFPMRLERDIPVVETGTKPKTFRLYINRMR